MLGTDCAAWSWQGASWQEDLASPTRCAANKLGAAVTAGERLWQWSGHSGPRPVRLPAGALPTPNVHLDREGTAALPTSQACRTERISVAPTGKWYATIDALDRICVHAVAVNNAVKLIHLNGLKLIHLAVSCTSARAEAWASSHHLFHWPAGRPDVAAIALPAGIQRSDHGTVTPLAGGAVYLSWGRRDHVERWLWSPALGGMRRLANRPERKSNGVPCRTGATGYVACDGALLHLATAAEPLICNGSLVTAGQSALCVDGDRATVFRAGAIPTMTEVRCRFSPLPACWWQKPR